jgi:uncharacterized cupin superfamily protein
MAEERSRPIVRTPGNDATLRNPQGGPLTFRARGDQTGGVLTVFENVAAPGEGPPLHLHVNQDELMYVLEGSLRLRLEGTFHTAPAVRSCSSQGACPTPG